MTTDRMNGSAGRDRRLLLAGGHTVALGGGVGVGFRGVGARGPGFC